MSNEGLLVTAFREAGKKYGYDTVDAEFVAFKDFKVRWSRSYKWASFKVSDYLMDADEVVLKQLAEVIYTRIKGLEGEIDYPPELHAYVTEPKFVDEKQPIFLKRSRNITKSAEGEFKDLYESYNRLADLGLVEIDPKLHLTWTRDMNVRKVGHCSVLMKVISITRLLDADMVPDFVLDYALYHELCHMTIGFDPTCRKHDEMYVPLDDKYPQHKEAREWLKRLILVI